MIMYRVKNGEHFKDGNILGGRFIKAGEVLVVSESDKQKLEQSGALLEVLETLVPNPLKKEAVEPVVVEAPVEPAKRRGRPRKNEA